MDILFGGITGWLHRNVPFFVVAALLYFLSKGVSMKLRLA